LARPEHIEVSDDGEVGFVLFVVEVGQLLPRLGEKSDDIDVEKWGRARSTTWRVTPEPEG